MIFDTHGNGVKPRIRYDREYARTYSGEIFWVYRIFEVPRYIFFSFERVPKQYRIIFDKVTKKKYSIELENALSEDISGGPFFDPIECSDNKLLSWVDALALKKYVASDSFINSVVKNPEKKKALRTLAESLNETENPVLIVVTPNK